jgi:hypothetical protein
MALWNKLKTELDRAGRAAQNALDEGKLRLEAFRARQLADKAAQTLGYAVFRARRGGKDLDEDTFARLVAALGVKEAEVERIEGLLKDAERQSPASTSPPPPEPPPAPTPPAAAPPTEPPPTI